MDAVHESAQTLLKRPDESQEDAQMALSHTHIPMKQTTKWEGHGSLPAVALSDTRPHETHATRRWPPQGPLQGHQHAASAPLQRAR